ncbi:MAG: PD40 domain-containing protein, partial [Fibrobacteres bacterium]|nr:PD40 domain-containing protein [Fibrobacterota bacterium]
IAEEVYGYFKEDYGFELPKKMEIIFDDEDYSNGWAWASANTIRIWVSGLDFEMRGFNNWLRNVIVHEFAHIVSIQVGQKTRYNIPDIRFGYMDYFNERNQAGFFSLYSFDIFPMWFAEGIAQFEATRRGSDSWDTHRDMLMRVKALNDKILPLNQMNMFIGRSKDFEGGPYNQGFSLVRYISEKYGYESIKRICDECRKFKNLTFDMALKSAIGAGTDSLYREWVSAQKVKYKTVADSIGVVVEGAKLSKDSTMDLGFRNLYPRWSFDGKELFFLSNTGRDGGRATLHKWIFSDTVKEEKKRFESVWPFVNDFYTLVDSGKKVASARAGNNPFTGETNVDAVVDSMIELNMKDMLSLTFSPYRKTEDGTKANRVTSHITYEDHIQQASVSNNGKLVAVVRKEKNKNSLLLISNNDIRRHKLGNLLTSLLFGVERNAVVSKNSETQLFRDNKSNNDGFLIFGPRFSPDDSLIVFGYFKDRDMNIGMVDLKGNFKELISSPADDRDPDFTPDGKYVVFSSDRCGIFNLYRVELATGITERLTNVAGGAFQPAVSPDGSKIAYSNYDSSGFSVYLTPNVPLKSDSVRDGMMCKKVEPKPIQNISFVREPRPYSPLINRVLFMPMVIGEELTSATLDADKGKFGVKAGGLLWLSDPLEKNSLIALGLLEFSNGLDIVGTDHGRHFFFNPSHDKEMMLLFENKSFYPTLSVSLAKFLIADTGSFYNSSEYRYAKDSYLIDVQDYAFDAAIPILGPTRTLRAGIRYAQQSVDFYAMDYPFKYSFYRTLNPFVQYTSTTFGNPMKGWRQEDAIDPRGSVLRVRYEYSSDQILVDGSSWQESFTIGDGGKIIEKFSDSVHNRLTVSYGTSFAAPVLPALTVGAEAAVSIADRPVDKFVYPGIFMNSIPFLENSSRLTFEGRNTGKAAAFLRFPIVKRIRKSTGTILFDKIFGSVFAEAGVATGLDPSWKGRSDLSQAAREGRYVDSLVARLPRNSDQTRVPVFFAADDSLGMERAIDSVETANPNLIYPNDSRHVVYNLIDADTVHGFINNFKTLLDANVQTGFGAELRFENYILPGYPLFLTVRYASKTTQGDALGSLERYFTNLPWKNPDGVFYVNAGFSFDSWITDRNPEYGLSKISAIRKKR